MIAYVALGSNLGNRSKNISFGISELCKLGRLTCSPLVIESEDESGIGPPYLNTVIKLDACIADPRVLLEECLRTELACGRDRTLPPNSPRVLDLDLIAAEGWLGNWEWDAPGDLFQIGPKLTLILPHPRAEFREFVMKPLKALYVKLQTDFACHYSGSTIDCLLCPQFVAALSVSLPACGGSLHSRRSLGTTCHSQRKLL
ncbi:MAG: 2-amino-4-hydroxy-6-hydroxymethyldihydropteridine diphosphokinase [Holophagales bacterium]|nr:2-amino-4-hydroxy-6-hydroxymethyldihydropteridine diphosphokinase [Holophagales bacterium]